MIKLDKQRELFINEMKRIEEALKKTKSEYLQKDYSKALRDMKRELRDYDKFRKQAEIKIWR